MKTKKTTQKFSLHMPQGYNFPIHLSVLVLNLFGVLMVISSSMTSDGTPKKLLIVGLKEMAFVVLSYIMMVWVARRFSLKFFTEHFYKFLLGLGILLLATQAFAPVGGAKAWINLKVMTLQPSEFAKIFVMLTVAIFLGDRNKKMKISTFDFIKIPVVIILLIFVYVAKGQHDLGSAVVIFGIAYICFLVPSHDKLTTLQKGMAVMAVVGIVLLVLIDTEVGSKFVEKIVTAIGQPYMLDRFKTAANPFNDRYGSGYQNYNAMVAMVKGGLFGVGYGNSVIKYGYLPEAHTDFILAVIVEELGMIGFLIVFVGYATILYQLLKYAFQVPKEKEKIILVGTITYIIIHYIFNIGGLTALIPLTGVPLLFISKGGSSRMAIMVAIGLTQNVISRFERAKIQEKNLERKRHEALEIRRRQGINQMHKEVAEL